MREIKFRAWDKKNKEMINDIWIAPEDDWGVFSDNDAMCEREKPERYQMLLMQYTGLKDKNGKEIYEGDIVKWNSWNDGRKEGWRIGSVIWHKKELGFRIEGNYVEFSPAIYTQIEVIGNIYENPELVKEDHV